MRKLEQFDLEVPECENIFPGHVACAGCGESAILRLVLKVLGSRVVVSTTAACSSGVAQNFTVPSSHGPFPATAAWATGVKAGLEAIGDMETMVLAVAGDGGTFDIGMQGLSGAAERNEDYIFLCLDNEAYMTTGIQRSSSTPPMAWTTTTPLPRGKTEAKKDIVAILAAHRIPYIGTATMADPGDLIRKVEHAKSLKGFRFLYTFAPCPTGWRHAPNLTIKISRLAVQSKVFPLLEVEDGRRYTLQKPKNEIPVREYLKAQGRFAHLNDAQIEEIQKRVDSEWEYLRSKASVCNEI